MSRAFRFEGIVLKRVSFAETDRIVTLFSQNQGKQTLIAKGSRKITSKRLGSLEPGSHLVAAGVAGHTWPILTEVRLLHSFHHAYHNLTRLTQTCQILEIVDLLTAEAEPNPEVFGLLLETLTNLETNGHKKAYLLEQIRLILQAMGFTYDKVFTEAELQAYIEDLGQRRLKTKAFLSVPKG